MTWHFQKPHLTVADICLITTNQEILQLKQNHQMKGCKYIVTIVGLGVRRCPLLMKLKQTNHEKLIIEVSQHFPTIICGNHNTHDKTNNERLYTNQHYTNWFIQIEINKLTERTQGRVINKGKVARQTSKFHPHPLLMWIMNHHYLNVMHTTHITTNFWTLTNERPHGFPIIGFSLSFVTLILIFYFIFVFIIRIVVNTIITEQKESKGLVHVTKEYTK